MRPPRLLACSFAFVAALAQAQAPSEKPRSSAEVLAASSASDWRRIDDENLMMMNLPQGQVLIELAPSFAPRHVANIKTLVREKYFDGLAVMRVQDNYVTQWGDAEAKKPIKSAQKTLPAEFFRKLDDALAFTPLGDADAYGSETGFSNGLPTVRDVKKGEAWLAHCYAMVGAGRDNAADSGGGTELYAVIGHAPRHLDRNVTLLGRVVQGIDLLSSLPRGTEALGFYKTKAQRVPISRVRIAADLPAGQRPALEALRTDTPTWAAYVDARRHRREEWFVEPTGHIEVCNVPLPIRIAKK
ncbi:MAG: peptidylprolyl isomerase [Pseudomonadota bacterium]